MRYEPTTAERITDAQELFLWLTDDHGPDHAIYHRGHLMSDRRSPRFTQTMRDLINRVAKFEALRFIEVKQRREGEDDYVYIATRIRMPTSAQHRMLLK